MGGRAGGTGGGQEGGPPTPHNGNVTSKHVSPGFESKRISPLCRTLTMRRAMSRPRPLPSPDGLVVKNGSKIFSWTLGGDAGAVVADVDHDLSPSRRVRRIEMPRLRRRWRRPRCRSGWSRPG